MVIVMGELHSENSLTFVTSERSFSKLQNSPRDVLYVYFQKLKSYVEIRHRYLQNWAFPETSTLAAASTLDKLVDCMKTLYEQVTHELVLFLYFCPPSSRLGPWL